MTDPSTTPAPDWSLEQSTAWYSHWLRGAALPLWLANGVDPQTGGFREGLTLDGATHDPFRRARVQGRQAYVFATLADGVTDPKLEIARRGLGVFMRHGRRRDGLFACLLSGDGEVLDATARLYEQDFVLLALAAVAGADFTDANPVEEGGRLRQALASLRHPPGGFREADDHPFQANAHMHLLEATLAWEVVDPDPEWVRLADEVATLALDRFIDPRTGHLEEFFDENWLPLRGGDGLIEPGHMFEWAWLIERWARRRGMGGRPAARRLFELGRAGLDGSRGVIVNALWPDLTVRDGNARLWPQTEYLKAAVLLGEDDDARTAAAGLARYLETPVSGVWRDVMLADGGFAPGHAPATSLYHILGAVQALEAR